MKKCVHCGCYNQDARTMCADCGRILADAEIVSEEEIDDKLENLSQYSEPFSFKPRHQVVFYASLALLAANIVLNLLCLMRIEMMVISILCSGFCVILTRFSETMWNMQKFFLQFSVSGDIEPSDWWFISREIEIFAFFIIGMITFLYGLAK